MFTTPPLQPRGVLPVGRRRRPDRLRDDTRNAAARRDALWRVDLDGRMRRRAVARDARESGERVSRRRGQGARHRSNGLVL